MGAQRVIGVDLGGMKIATGSIDADGTLHEQHEVPTPTDSQEALLEAIADGTFGLMRRPADAGRGLDGVAKKSSVYYNPASEFLEEER